MLSDFSVGASYVRQVELLDVVNRRGGVPVLRESYNSAAHGPTIISPRHMEQGNVCVSLVESWAYVPFSAHLCW
jgi:hypothetical protein